MIDETWYRRPAGVPQRTSAGGVIARVEGGRILVGLVREGDFAEYILPKGRLEPGEDVESAAVREIGEEAGITQLRLLRPLGMRERLSFDRRWWILTHYFLFVTAQTVGAPTDVEHVYRLEWHPLRDLPRFFWPEQAEVVMSAADEIERDLLAQAGGAHQATVEPPQEER